MNHTDTIYLLYGNQIVRLIGIPFSVISIIILIPIYYSIIWYEKYASNTNQTFLNKLVSSMSVVSILWLILIQLPETYRFINGPFSPSFCKLQSALKGTLITHLILLFCLVSIMRYVFVIGLRNPGTFDDEFWTLFLNMEIFLFALIPQLVFAILPGRDSLIFHICVGSISVDVQKMVPKSNVPLGFVQILSILIHVVIKLRLFIYKQDCYKVLMQHNSYNKPLKKLSYKTLSDFSINFANVCMLGGTFLLISRINSFHPNEVNHFHNSVVIYFFQLIYPYFCGLFAMSTFFGKNKHFRDCVMHELKEYFRNL